VKRSTLQKQFGREDDVRLSSAISTAAGSADLRFLLRTILYTLCEVQHNAFAGGKPDNVAFTLGRQSIAQELITMMDKIDTSLHPRLLQETSDERSSRTASLRLADPDDPAGF
jgi:hypothetical protein